MVPSKRVTFIKLWLKSFLDCFFVRFIIDKLMTSEFFNLGVMKVTLILWKLPSLTVRTVSWSNVDTSHLIPTPFFKDKNNKNVGITNRKASPLLPSSKVSISYSDICNIPNSEGGCRNLTGDAGIRPTHGTGNGPKSEHDPDAYQM